MQIKIFTIPIMGGEKLLEEMNASTAGRSLEFRLRIHYVFPLLSKHKELAELGN